MEKKQLFESAEQLKQVSENTFVEFQEKADLLFQQNE